MWKVKINFGLLTDSLKIKFLLSGVLFEEGKVRAISCQTLNMFLLSKAKFCWHDGGKENICDKRK